MIRELNAEQKLKQNELRTELLIHVAKKNDTKELEIEQIKKMYDTIQWRIDKLDNYVLEETMSGRKEVNTAQLRMLEARLDETIIELAETRNLRQTTEHLTPLNKAIKTHSQ